jgi:hypothetical protein
MENKQDQKKKTLVMSWGLFLLNEILTNYSLRVATEYWLDVAILPDESPETTT